MQIEAVEFVFPNQKKDIQTPKIGRQMMAGCLCHD